MKKNIFFDHPSMCSLPWTGVFVNPDGQIKNCGINRESIGNINQSSLEQILTNDVNQAIRSDMLNGIKHTRCNACYSVEENSKSKINESNRTWYKKIAIKNSNMEIFDSPKSFELSVLDLRWRNTCNFACVYCGPDLSSKWASMLTDDRWITAEENLEASKQYIFDNLKTVKHVYLAGGEPLLMKDNYELLQRLYDVNPDVDIRINSNISNLNNPVFSQLQKFKNVKWTISVESTGKIFEYMRWPGNWKEFVKNSQVIQQCAGNNINFNMVWCILNSFEIFDTFDFLIQQGFHENMFIVQCLSDPTPLSILHLPPDHIENLKIEIVKRMKNANPEWWLYKSLNSMYNFLNNPAPDFRKNYQIIDGSPGIKGTIEFLKRVDELRGNKESQHLFKTLYKIHDSY